MDEKILLGRGQQIHDLPQATWKQQLSQFPQRSQARLSFMTEDHHQVRYLAVRALVNTQAPVEPKFISAMLGMPLERVAVILDELERKLFFLVRNEKGAVAWAYPMTVEATPHRLKFSTGEHLFAA